MTVLFRLLLLFASLFSVLFFLSRVRRAKIRVDDCLFWILFAFLGMILSIFPGILDLLASALGILSPVNLLFLILLFVLIIRDFTLTIKLSQLQMKLNRLGQNYAMDESREKDK